MLRRWLDSFSGRSTGHAGGGTVRLGNGNRPVVLIDKTVKRLGRVEEVADLVAFVASPLADYINGANLRIDGGKSPSVN
jgi:NAD(P)-dependent dehydrogenase (short-subunit alcohol dehydrogenase family)